MKVTRPRAVLFDWDNTLVDSWAAIRHALNVTLRAMGQDPWSMEQTRARVRASARDSFPGLFGDRAVEATEIFYRTFEADHLDNLRPLPGARKMLEDLAEDRHLYLAVVSNKQGRLLRREAKHLGWDRFFGRLVGANDAARDKPAVEAVDLALRGSDLAADPQVWFVGDTDIDMLCAHNSGCLPVLLRRAEPGAGEFGDAGPRIHLRTCAALGEAIRQCELRTRVEP